MPLTALFWWCDFHPPRKRPSSSPVPLNRAWVFESFRHYLFSAQALFDWAPWDKRICILVLLRIDFLDFAV